VRVRKALGIDFGGSGIKGGVVDLAGGRLVSERFRLPTPQPAKPRRVAEVVAEVVNHFRWRGRVGCTVPGVVRNGRVETAANIHPSWIGVNAERLLAGAIGRPVTVLNDADAAGLAEVEWGVVAARRGVVLLLTFGTGIGSALLVDGRLVPNTELGHLEYKGRVAEDWTSAQQQEAIGWSRWARRVNRYIAHVDRLFSPDLIVLGGGITKEADRFLHLLDVRPRVRIATLKNNAGIAGAALAAARTK